jgi:hypothetical protein
LTTPGPADIRPCQQPLPQQPASRNLATRRERTPPASRTGVSPVRATGARHRIYHAPGRTEGALDR